MNNENIINCPECGAALDIDNVLFHQLEEKAKKSLQDEYNAKIKDLKNSLEDKFDQKEEKLKVREKDFLLKMEKLESDQENYNVTLNAKVKDETAKAQIQLEKQIKKELEDEQSERIKIMQNDLKKKSEQVKDLHRAKAESIGLLRNCCVADSRVRTKVLEDRLGTEESSTTTTLV